MTDLAEYSKEIEDFIVSGIEKFHTENGEPKSIGIYCCPWSGWISLNFNLKKAKKNFALNCPDSEFVEFDLYDQPDWSEEYEGSNKWKDSRFGHKYSGKQGDEHLNIFFFSFMKSLVKSMQVQKRLPEVFLQCLDSNCAELLKI